MWTGRRAIIEKKARDEEASARKRVKERLFPRIHRSHETMCTLVEAIEPSFFFHCSPNRLAWPVAVEPAQELRRDPSGSSQLINDEILSPNHPLISIIIDRLTKLDARS
jgi:hypothetical protein